VLTVYAAGLGMQNTNILAFFQTPLGILVANDFGDTAFVSADNGSTFTALQTSGAHVPNAPQVFMGKDSKGVWHELDHTGNVWTSPTDPGPTATWTRTWNPQATPPDPDPVPPQDCQLAFDSGYYAVDAQHPFEMTPDGQTMMYPMGHGGDPTGVCRSNDGGKNFLPITFPNPPAGAAGDEPTVILLTSVTHGIAANANDLVDASAFVYTTDDAGATWTAASLPASVTAAGSHAAIVTAFAAPDGQHIWLVGMTLVSSAQALLLKSSDGGKTWKDISAALAALPAAGNKMHTGFALDANNIWIGGDYGALLYSPSGGE
jgi:photosystem II stability/assembly factor-like uncharacterized protein